jgi:hypothetical protein
VTTDQISDAKVPDYHASVNEYHASRARYIRSVTADTEKKLLETVAKRRDPLKEEINNLTSLARARYAERQTTLKAYAAKAPGRVSSGGLLRTVLEQHGRELIAQLETPTGLEGTFKRDPLLGRAHARMLAAEARRASVRDATAPVEVPLSE